MANITKPIEFSFFLMRLAELKATNPTRSLYNLIRDAVYFHSPTMAGGMKPTVDWTDTFLEDAIEAYLKTHGINWDEQV